ncbi:sensor histidine kinase [Fredinandcohnia sp. 179-A 10B2 NHS]|uniref:sensor histidine kinase n=1 Tax=Fredinandcohnia sp. 179-A 10B2 NHS TaxID=3235176 RepID=UPI0039A05C0D
MKPAILYWGIITVLGIIHVHEVLSLLPWNIPLYIASVIVLFITYLLNKHKLLQVTVLGIKWNSFLFVLQVLLLTIYIFIEPSIVYFVPILVFVGIEVSRYFLSSRLFLLHEESKQFQEEREHFNETFRIVRNERHDFLKHVSALHFMLENGEAVEAKSYLDGMVEDYKETNLSIKGERGVVAGILHQMYRRAKDVGTEVIYDFDIPLSTLPLSDQQIVALIGNILSNAIDACEEWHKEYQEKPSLTFQFQKRSGLYILLCKNHTLPIPTHVLDELFHSYGQTTKSGKHEGLGTKIIKDIIDEANGFLDFICKDEEFTLKIKIPAIK